MEINNLGPETRIENQQNLNPSYFSVIIWESDASFLKRRETDLADVRFLVPPFLYQSLEALSCINQTFLGVMVSLCSLQGM